MNITRLRIPTDSREEHQLAIYKRYLQVQHQLVVRTGFEPATYGFQIRRSNHLATLPPQSILKQAH